MGGGGRAGKSYIETVIPAAPCYRPSGRPYRHSRVSGNPERSWKDQPVAVSPPPDSRLRGNDGGGAAGRTAGWVVRYIPLPGSYRQ